MNVEPPGIPVSVPSAPDPANLARQLHSVASQMRDASHAYDTTLAAVEKLTYTPSWRTLKTPMTAALRQDDAAFTMAACATLTARSLLPYTPAPEAARQAIEGFEHAVAEGQAELVTVSHFMSGGIPRSAITLDQIRDSSVTILRDESRAMLDAARAIDAAAAGLTPAT